MSNKNYKIHCGLAWTLTALHFSSGLAFLLKIPGIYRPDAYMIGPLGLEKPGDGTTKFENLARIPFGLCYVAPFISVIYAQFNGSCGAKKAASIFPIIYHLYSAFAAIFIFNDGLNPKVAPISAAFGQHLVFGIFCCGL